VNEKRTIRKEILQSSSYGCVYPVHTVHINPLADLPEDKDYKTIREIGLPNVEVISLLIC